jgi:hypothetical protein
MWRYALDSVSSGQSVMANFWEYMCDESFGFTEAASFSTCWANINLPTLSVGNTVKVKFRTTNLGSHGLILIYNPIIKVKRADVYNEHREESFRVLVTCSDGFSTDFIILIYFLVYLTTLRQLHCGMRHDRTIMNGELGIMKGNGGSFH